MKNNSSLGRMIKCMNVFSQPAAKQAMTNNAHRSEKAEPMDLAMDHRHLISAANKVFGEGRWSHTVVSQTLGKSVIN